ncbi:kinase-like protein [Fomitiporia mediterranea MF3/22]|uniref:kinase-like protein n=1 Tax=Fomitiporia mediterranea (strain MF3/22) TaxID=694068 RepID=UPI00044073B7|nr:kinase-like protein [Fomitiporia mediterranea MF3/22]EJC99805.1 kinase-like protein [Fomitiporia mediterranea MF3/22]
MARVNIQTYIPQLLNEWHVPEISERAVVRLQAIKGGRRAGILKGSYTSRESSVTVVAIKVVNTEYATLSNDPEKKLKLLIEYFKRECRIWRSLGQHANIVPLLGFVKPLQSEAFPALIMPYYEGKNLRIFVSERKVSLKEKVKLMRDVAIGLHHMHSLEPPAIHRDLKASNVIVEIINGTRYNARIMDFGSAKLEEAENGLQKTSNTSAPVSLPWTPPEYVKVDNSTNQSMIDYANPTRAGDIWSFGCTFLEMLKKDNPWDGYAIDKDLQKGRHPPRPENCFIDDNCWNVMRSCWSHDPLKRPNAARIIRYLTAIEARV